jgi:hypothetical protein
VLDVHQRQAFRPEGIQQPARLRSRFEAAFQGVLAAWKIIVLNVNQQQGSFHGSILIL